LNVHERPADVLHAAQGALGIVDAAIADTQEIGDFGAGQFADAVALVVAENGAGFTSEDLGISEVSLTPFRDSVSSGCRPYSSLHKCSLF
jgi:hypothetical protein